MGEDRTTALGRFDVAGTRLGEDRDVGKGSLIEQLRRATEDRETTGVRAGRENIEYGKDVNEIRMAQAQGQLPPLPGRPRYAQPFTYGSQHPSAPPTRRRRYANPTAQGKRGRI